MQMMNTVYIKNNNGRLQTYFSLEALHKAGFLEDDCVCVPIKDYPGSAYIDKTGCISLGLDPEITKNRTLSRLKQYLAETDYVVIKIAEGVATKEEYKDILEKRAETRKQINELEGN